MLLHKCSPYAKTYQGSLLTLHIGMYVHHTNHQSSLLTITTHDNMLIDRTECLKRREQEFCMASKTPG